jgi:hypothetical protein
MTEKKVFGVGWAKTGTTSLGFAMRRLGYKHKSMDLKLVDHYVDRKLEHLYSIVDQHESFEDWPWLLMYKEFDDRYPNAKFILTIRDEKKWLQSYRSMLVDQGVASDHLNSIRKKLYGSEFNFPNVTDDQLLNRYRIHNNDVINYFKGRPDKLLVVDWTNCNGYEVLSKFLNIPLVIEEFPHVNKATDRKKYAEYPFLKRFKMYLKRKIFADNLK